MKKYSIKMQAPKALETAINQEIIATFELSAINENAAQFRAQKMMSFIMDGYIEERGLNPAICDDGATIIDFKEI